MGNSDDEGERTPTPQTTMQLEESQVMLGEPQATEPSNFFPAMEEEGAGPLIEENEDDIAQHAAAHAATAATSSLLLSPHRASTYPHGHHHHHHHDPQQQLHSHHDHREGDEPEPVGEGRHAPDGDDDGHPDDDEDHHDDDDMAPEHYDEENEPQEEIPPPPAEYDCGDGNCLAWTYEVPDPSKPTETKRRVVYHALRIREELPPRRPAPLGGSLPTPGGSPAPGVRLTSSPPPPVPPQVPHGPTGGCAATHPDARPLVCLVECGIATRETSEYRFAVCGATELITKPFSEYFTSTTLLKSVRSSSLLTLCICPTHRQCLLVDPLADLVIAASQFPHRVSTQDLGGEGVGVPSSSSPAAVVNKGTDDERPFQLWRVAVEAKEGYVRFFDCQRPNECLCSLPTACLFDMHAA